MEDLIGSCRQRCEDLATIEQEELEEQKPEELEEQEQEY